MGGSGDCVIGVMAGGGNDTIGRMTGRRRT